VERKHVERNPLEADNRRVAVRHDSSELGTVMARVLGVCNARLIDISRSGVLFESEARLTMGDKVSLRITTSDTSVALKGVVVRSKLTIGDKAALYQTALRLDEDVTLISELELTQAATTGVAEDEVEFVATVPHDFSELQRMAASHDV
jgi:hypothetical protein